MQELKIEYLTLDKLKPYDKNARKHQEADLSTIKASITEFGMSDPKPCDLFAQVVKKFDKNKEFNKVLDLFGGSGSTLIAC